MLEKVFGIDNVAVGAGIGVIECAKWKPRWRIEKYHGDVKPENLYAIEEFDGNLLLNSGINALLNLLIGSGTAFNNTNARIGVGDSSTAASASQTDLQASTNKAYAAMDATYPQVSGQTVTFRATFGSGVAAFAWNEFVIKNNATGVCLNRKVEAHGSKASADTWVVQVQITIS